MRDLNKLFKPIAYLQPIIPDLFSLYSSVFHLHILELDT
jgi:hypothetical protein